MDDGPNQVTEPLSIAHRADLRVDLKVPGRHTTIIQPTLPITTMAADLIRPEMPCLVLVPLQPSKTCLPVARQMMTIVV